MPTNGRNVQKEIATGDMTSAIEDLPESATEAPSEIEQEEPRKRVRVLQYSRSDLLI
jgi:hypothetical protein